MNIGELIATIGADTTKFDQALTRTENRLKSAGKSMQKAGRQMSMAVTAPLVAVGALGLRTAANFESAMNQVKAVSGATGDEFKQLEGIARELGASTKFSATEAAEGMGFLAMAGFDVKEIMQAMPATLNLAAAGNMQLAESADIVSNIMQGFGLEAAQTGETVDILTKTFTSSNTSLTQLGEAMSYVAPAARAFGQDITMTSAAVGILSDAGIQASKAGTGLRQAFIQLQKKSDDLGISVTDTNGKMLPLVDILQNIEDAGLTTAEVINTVGPRAGTALAALIDRGPQALRDFTTELNNTGGTAKQVADTQMEGLSGALKELRSAVSEVAISFTKEFGNSIESLVDKVKGAAQWLGNLSGETKQLILTIAGIAAAIGPVLVVTGVMVSQVGNLIKAGRVLNTVMKLSVAKVGALKMAMGGVVTIVAAAVAGFIRHKKAVDSFNDATQEMADANRAARESIAGEKAEVETLISTIEDENATRQQKLKAFEELKKVAPDYFGDLRLEDGLLKNLKKSQEEYNKELLKNARIEAYKDKLVELNKELINLQEEGAEVGVTQAIEGISRALTNAEGGFIITESASKAAEVAQEEYRQKVEQTKESINRMTNSLVQAGKETEMTSSAFAEQSQRLSKNKKLTLDLSGTQKELQSRLEEVRGKMVQLASAGEPIPERLQDMAKQYSKRLAELKVQQQEAAAGNTEIADTTKDVITQLDSLSTRFDKPIIPPERAEEAKELMRGLTKAISGFQKTGEITTEGPQIEGEMSMRGTTPSPEELAGVDALAERWETTANRISSAINGAVTNIATGMAAMVGKMAAGTAGVRDIGNMVLGTLADLAIRVGKIAVGTAIAIEGIKKALQSLNPIAAAAAGIALIALGSFVKASLNKAAEGQTGGEQPRQTTGLQGLATGGEVVRQGTFMVGEQGPELVDLPRGAAVTPNHALNTPMMEDQLVASISADRFNVMLKRNEKSSKRRG